MVKPALEVFNAYNTVGIPSSGLRTTIDLDDTREWGTDVETRLAGVVIGQKTYPTKTAMDADTAPAINTGAFCADSDSTKFGWYYKSAAAGSAGWTRISATNPWQQVIVLTDAGAGSSNSLVTTSSIAPPPGAYQAIYLLTPFEANTSGADLSVNSGAAKSILLADGSALPANALRAGRTVILVDTGASYRLITETLLPVVNFTAAGTGNAITGTVASAYMTTPGATMFFCKASASNTGAVTVAINGGTAKALVTNSGAAMQSGYIVANMILAFQDDGTNYRLISDVASSAIQTAAAASATAAAASATAVAGQVTTLLDPNFATRAAALAYTPILAPDYIAYAGYTTAGDGGESLFKKVGSEPAHPGKLSLTFTGSGGGTAWYEIVPHENTLTPEQFGAVGDGVTNDRTALVNCNAALEAFSTVLLGFPTKEMWLVGRNTYAVNDTLTLSRMINIDLTHVKYIGSDNEACVVIGEAANYSWGRKIRIGVFNGAQSDWTNEASIGVLIYRGFQMDLDIVQAEGFTRGVVMNGVNGGFSYSSINLGYLANNKVGLDIVQTDPNGYVNELHFRGGRFSVDSGVNNGLDRIGVRIRSEGNYTNNSINFYAPSFEMNRTAATGRAIGMLVNRVVGVNVYGGRDESNDVFCIMTGDAGGLDARLGYSNSGDSSDPGQGPLVEMAGRNGVYQASAGNRSQGLAGSSSWVSPNFDSAYQTDTAAWGLPGMAATASWSSTNYARGSVGIIAHPDYLQLGIPSGSQGALWAGFDVRMCKQIKIMKKPVSGFFGRFAIRCFDANMAALTPPDSTLRANSTAYTLGNFRRFNDASATLVTGLYLECTTAGTTASSAPTVPEQEGATVTDGTCVWTVRGDYCKAAPGSVWTVANNQFQDGSSADVWKLAAFSSDVAYVYIGVLGAGTEVCRLISPLQVVSMDSRPIIPVPIIRGQDFKASAVVPSNRGFYGLGEEIKRATPASGQPVAWSCSTAGFASSTLHATSTAYAIDDVVYNGARVYVCTAAGTSGASSPPTGTGSAITDGTVTWKYAAERAAFIAHPNL